MSENGDERLVQVRRIDATGIVDGLRKIAERSQSLLESLPADTDEDHRDTLRRAQRVATLAFETIDEADPDLVSLTVVDAMNGWVTTAGKALDIADPLVEATSGTVPIGRGKTQKSWDEALLHATDAILDYTGRINVALPEQELVGVRRELASVLQETARFRNLVEHELARIENIARIREQELSQSSDRLRAQLEEVKDRLTNEQERIDSALQQYEEQFRDDQGKRNTEFREQVTQLADKELTRIRDKAQRDVDDLLEDMLTKQKQVEAVAGAVGASALGGRFKQYADDEQKRADKWQQIATGITIALAAAGIGGFFVVLLVGVEDLSTLFARSALFGPALAFAIYAARQATKHRETAHVARSAELDLVALDPFLKTMTDAEAAQTIRGVVALRWLGSEARGNSKVADELSEDYARGLLRRRTRGEAPVDAKTTDG